MPVQFLTYFQHLRLNFPLSCRWLIFIALFIFSSVLPADQSVKISVVQSGSSAVYKSVSNSVADNLQSICKKDATYQCPSVEWVPVNATKQLPLDTLKSSDLILSLGKNAATLTAEQSLSISTLFALLPESAFQKLLKKHRLLTNHSTSIYLDQPLSRQFQLISQATPDKKRVGILVSPASTLNIEKIKATAKRYQLEIVPAYVDTSDELGPTLKHLIKQIDILLSLPDPQVFNRKTIFSILLTTYHHRIPVIGFSKAYVKAGALVAVHSTPEQIGKHIAENIYQQLRNPQLSPALPQFPRYFSVMANKSVGRSLDINIDEEELLAKLQQMGDGE